MTSNAAPSTPVAQSATPRPDWVLDFAKRWSAAKDETSVKALAWNISGAFTEWERSRDQGKPRPDATSEPPSPYLQAKLEGSVLLEALKKIAALKPQQIDTGDEMIADWIGAVNAARAIARSAIASVESGGKDKVTGDTNG